MVLLSEGVPFVGNTTLAQDDTNLPCSVVIYKGEWFTYTPLVTGTATVRFVSYFLDYWQNYNQLEVAQGACGALTPVACVHYYDTGEASFRCVSNQVYRICYGGGVAGRSGDFTITASAVEDRTLAQSLDNTLTWRTGGVAPWYAQKSESYAGPDAARSGAIGHGQASWLETTVTGPGEMSFWWKVSSQAGGDVLGLGVDGTNGLRSISGTLDWRKEWYSVGNGTHTFRWAYAKNASGTSGTDAGWLDQVRWAPADGYRTKAVWDQGAVLWSNGWSHLNWFAHYADLGLTSPGWIWHEYHDYLYMKPQDTPGSIYFYATDMGWLWTSRTSYPYLYRFTDGAWLWYSAPSDDPRWFLNLTTGLWESH